jgi:hypothetical protein
MDVREKYIDFMLDNVIGSDIRVQLPNPQEDGKLFWTKLGPTVYIKVDLEVIEKYTRSVKFKLKFDKYELEQIIFIPIESSPMSIKEKLHNTIENLVCKTFLEDGRQEEIRQMYEEKRKTMFSGLEKMVGKMKEIDEYGDAYKNYLIEDAKVLPNMSKEKMIEMGFRLTQEEFINKIKTDEEFAKRWGNTSNKIVE